MADMLLYTFYTSAIVTYFILCACSKSAGGQSREGRSASNPSIGSGGSKSVLEPNVDFELDVKVFIDSGKCVLHPKENKEEDKR